MWKLIITSIIALLIMIFLFGCATPGSMLPDAIPKTPTESMFKAVAKADWFATFCLISFFGGIVAIGLDQKKIGGAVVIAAIATMSYGLAVQRFPTWMAVTGFISSLLAVGYSIFIKNRTLTEIVEGGEEFKKVVSSITGDEHGIYNFNRTHDLMQSESTKKTVDKIQKKLNHETSKNQK